MTVLYFQIAALRMCRTEQLEDGEWVEDQDQMLQLKANFIISAFGSGLYDSDGKKTWSCQAPSSPLWTWLRYRSKLN